MAYVLPKLNYEYNALEPYIDAKTMEIHHTKHHQTYLTKLNEGISKHPDLFKKSAEELVRNLNNAPDDIKAIIKNHGGGYINHNFFWEILKKDVKLSGKIKEAIDNSFGGYEKFKEDFTKSATALFGSGWTWLVTDGKKLEIINTNNQDSPLTLGKTPLLNLDIWEHAYYLKYQNRRAEYIEAFFNIINWDKVEHNLKKVQ
jgi:superoxide dismutase, Fe-Mn family